MKKIAIWFVSVMFVVWSPLCRAALPGLLTDVFEEREGVTFEQRIQKQIDPLVKQKEELFAHYNKEHRNALEEAYKNLNVVRKAREVKGLSEPEQEFSNRKALLQSEIVETLTGAEQAYQAAIAIHDEHIKLLEAFKSDPEFKEKDLRIPDKSIYSNEDLEKLDGFILYYTDELRGLKDRLEQASADLVNRKKTVQLATQEYEAKIKQQKALKVGELDGKSTMLSIKQQGELLDMEVRLHYLIKELAEIRFIGVENRQSLLENQRRIAERQLAIVQAEYERIKPDLRIDEKDVKAAQAEYKRMTANFEKKQADGQRLVSAVDFVKMAELNQIDSYEKRFGLTDAQVLSIRNWTFEATTREQWMALIAIGRLSSHITEKQIDREDALAQIDKARALQKAEEVHYMLVKTWHQLTMGRFAAFMSEDLAKEIKRYEMEKAELEMQNSKTAEMRSHAEQALNDIARIIDNIKARLKQLRSQKETVFAEQGDEYTRFSATLMDEIYDDARRRSDKITQTIEVYNGTTLIRNRAIKKIDSMINELRARAHWRDVFPFWKGLKKFIPDVNRFISYIRGSSLMRMVRVNKAAVAGYMGYYKRNFSALMLFILKILLLIASFILLRLYLPDFIYLLRVLSPPYGVGKTILSFVIVTLEYINTKLGYLAFLILVVGLVVFGVISDPKTGIFLIFATIPFWLILVYQYLSFLRQINTEQGQLFVAEEHEKRFFTVLGVALYSTVLIFLLRQAFFLFDSKSMVPSILNAFNLIILQICALFLISKEQILAMIPQAEGIGWWLYEGVKKYYSVLMVGLIILIILSNPYLGYGPYFFDIFFRVLAIIALVPGFYFLFKQTERLGNSLFFQSDDGAVKERFSNARTVYGLFIIFATGILILLALLIAGWIAGYALGLTEIYEWLNAELYSFQDTQTGKSVIVNAITLARAFFYVVLGVFAAYLVKRFVLGRIFDLLLVNIGIQNTLIALIWYGIIIVATILGLQSIGLRSSLPWIFGLIAGLGVAGKEIISDILGYFMILVQQPLQIGDFIQLDKDVNGVVRHITFRSVILRRKNSVTVIVPNSQVMNKPLANWNYSRNYVAHNDILITVPYAVDPDFVTGLIHKVLDENMNVLKNPRPIIRLSDFVDNGFQFMVRGYLSFDKVLDQWDIASDIRLEIVRVLRQHDIKVASPTRIVTLKSSSSGQDSSDV